ncbi:hypothetical protein CEUSTIGMA_g12419.t1 [Chlamydomonas eustigma]|uniref:EF-hand domain-containing protein n=1 Tax=Chlamydomonas eustigma TaxID=1157962 RepID=A0A250XPL2_9CHLO|nr:hypothetical protein CEUSTIGMA_g12419.t1 [Chlamydomonas eustigma]|eukprot:GAX84998.1 hypothetical protein CEUSTIGMA_g12419.t1 [Chlamydomonas eustigma]
MEKRNVFGLFRMWLKRQGSQATLQALIQQTETEASTSGKGQSISGGGGSPDGTLDLYELQQLLRKAIPDCSSLEAQMFMAMVDVNGDEKLNLQELDANLSDCREIDSIVSGAGEPEKRKQLEAELASKVQTLRTKSGQLTEALQSAANKRGGYVTFQDLSATFQDIFTDITPESKRMLITHVARTANVSAADLGLPVTEVQKVLGLKLYEAAKIKTMICDS